MRSAGSGFTAVDGRIAVVSSRAVCCFGGAHSTGVLVLYLSFCSSAVLPFPRMVCIGFLRKLQIPQASDTLARDADTEGSDAHADASEGLQ